MGLIMSKRAMLCAVCMCCPLRRASQQVQVLGALCAVCQACSATTLRQSRVGATLVSPASPAGRLSVCKGRAGQVCLSLVFLRNTLVTLHSVLLRGGGGAVHCWYVSMYTCRLQPTAWVWLVEVSMVFPGVAARVQRSSRILLAAGACAAPAMCFACCETRNLRRGNACGA